MDKIDRLLRTAPVVLPGRSRECAALDALLTEVRGGRSGALVLRGEPGVGKSALLDYAVNSASGFGVSRADGVESEMELPYAALHQLCGRMMDRVDGLPEPQANALSVAFGVRSGESPDRFLVSLAALTLMSDVAAEQPLLCVVDDAQWLDQASAQALAFVARRIGTESIALVFGIRDSVGSSELLGLSELFVEGLADVDARVLLESAIPGRLDERVRDRIIAEARGNPLALLELPRGIAPGDLAGGFGLSSASLSGHLEETFVRRHATLPEPTRLLLLVAAAEPVGDPEVLWHAARGLSIGIDDAAPAESAGLLRFGIRVVFRHPLVRSSIYGAAAIGDRQRVHRALAAATDAERDPDRRAWHRAQGAQGPDEDVAEELERSAGRALSRGGLAAAAAFLERATALSADPVRRARRALAGGALKHQCGAPDAALELLTIAEGGPLDDLQRAQLERLRGQVAFGLRRGRDAPPMLLEAARRFAPLDVGLARETYLEALTAAIFVNPFGGVRDAAEAARTAPPPLDPPRAGDLLLDALVTRFTEGYAAGVAPLRRALQAFCREGDPDADDLRWLGLACRIAPDLWEYEMWDQLTSRYLQLARDSGALTVLPIAASYRAAVHVFGGDFAAASALTDEADAITQSIGSAALMATSLVLIAWRGQEGEALAVIEAGLRDATARGEGNEIALAAYASAVLYNGLGRYAAARAAGERIYEHDELGLFGGTLFELIEAATRCGEPAIARGAFDRLRVGTSASGTGDALAIESLSRALLCEGRDAEALYREAIERLSGIRNPLHLARAHLLYGEWLRRELRRADARAQLRTARAMFVAMGTDAFAERAERELRATGEQIRKRSVEAAPNRLTGQEEQIAQLASTGTSNADIAAQLFISPRTVEYHLHKVFAKLDITSRNQLGGVLSASSPSPR